jgi:hypothetical protein
LLSTSSTASSNRCELTGFFKVRRALSFSALGRHQPIPPLPPATGTVLFGFNSTEFAACGGRISKVVPTPTSLFTLICPAHGLVMIPWTADRRESFPHPAQANAKTRRNEVRLRRFGTDCKTGNLSSPTRQASVA